MNNNKKFIRIGFFLVLLLWFGYLAAEQINLATADLGRHLKNGEIISDEGLKIGEPNTVLNSNYYSYTYPDYPFINHHWASGVVFYWIYKLVGFSGLSIFYILVGLLIFSIMFYVAYRGSNFTIAAILSSLLIPLMADRREIRPEAFSYLFSAVFFALLWFWKTKKISWKWLFFLPFLMVFWVNLHIYFFLGLFLIGVFLISDFGAIFFSRLSDEEFGDKIRNIKQLLIIAVLSGLATLVNPFGIKGALHPLQVYKNYGYTVAEEKSVSFVENYGLVNSNFLLIKVILILIALSFFLHFVVNKKKISVPNLMFAIFFGVIGWMQIRNMTLFGFFALPILAINLENIFTPDQKDNSAAKENGLAVVYITILIIAAVANFQFVSSHASTRGIGPMPGVTGAAEFLNSEKIIGPIFNNYDIGGYLIWYLPAGKSVFVDNRPEVYPSSFFSDVYKPMQENPDVFERVDQEYNFNATVFYRNDMTPWGMNFLKMIRENADWVLVYEDRYAVIYLKKNDANQSVIEKYGIQTTN